MAFHMSVSKAMDDVVIGVKAMADDGEILRVACIIPAKDSVSDVICDLNQPRGPGIDQKWRVGDVLKYTPLCADLTEFAAELLKRRLSRCLVENDHATLRIARRPEPAQAHVEAPTKVLDAISTGSLPG